jgi:hypothetical protein
MNNSTGEKQNSNFVLLESGNQVGNMPNKESIDKRQYEKGR